MRLPAAATTTQMANNPGDNNDDGKDVEKVAACAASKSDAKDAQTNPNMREVDYSEYEWMEHIEEFDREVIRELEEQAFFEQCFMEASGVSEEEGYCDLEEELAEFNDLAIFQAENAYQVTSTPLNPSAPEFIPKSFSLGNGNGNGVDG